MGLLFGDLLLVVMRAARTMHVRGRSCLEATLQVLGVDFLFFVRILAVLIELLGQTVEHRRLLASLSVFRMDEGRLDFLRRLHLEVDGDFLLVVEVAVGLEEQTELALAYLRHTPYQLLGDGVLVAFELGQPILR